MCWEALWERKSVVSEDLATVTPNKITVNLAVENASIASAAFRRLFDAEVLLDCGEHYVLTRVGRTRIAFVSGEADLSSGRPAIAVEVESADDCAAVSAVLGKDAVLSDHPSGRYWVGRSPGSVDVIYYAK